MLHTSSHHARRLYRAAQVRELDQAVMRDNQISGELLMEQAGQAAYQVLLSHWSSMQSITVFCGGGNNGGDGYVVARLAAADGIPVRVISLAGIDRLKGDARTAAEKLVASGIKPEPFSGEINSDSGLLVDALLGTGLDREVKSELATCIGQINAAANPVFSIDIPSGLAADTGRVLGTAVRADATVSFIGLKQGLLTGCGPDHTGALFYEDLDSRSSTHEAFTPSAWRLDYAGSQSLLVPRHRCAHKGENGHVLVIGGDAGFAGACRLAGEAAGRCGAGLVSVATRPQNAPFTSMARPELMAHGVDSATDLDALLQRASVIAIGPGLGQTAWSRTLLGRALESTLPMVVDADALNMLAQDPAHREDWILTPHPGEAARLLQCSTREIQADRFAAVSELQSRYGGVCILKGCGTLVFDSDQCVSVCTDGNPGMATGGMGDVLTGVIAALLAQKFSLTEAARLGVCLHGRAADLASSDGERGMLAGDLMPFLRLLANPD